MRLLLIEDGRAYQLAMAAHLQRLAGVKHVLVAGDGEQALDWLQREPIDLVVLDLVLPGMGGLATCRHITSSSAVPVLILTSQEDPQWVQQIWQAGARGYLHKERGFEQMEMALQPPSAASAGRRPEETRHLDSLTARERDVLRCIAEGDDNRTIARRLGIGEGTVRSHVHVLLQKLQVSNRTQAALRWLAQGPETTHQSQATAIWSPTVGSP